MACGDVGEGFQKLISTVEAQAAKVGAFDVLFCVGGFFPDKAPAAGLSPYLSGEKQLPLPVFFIDSGPGILQAAPEGKQLCENLMFLGGYGVRQICSLRVAFMSGHYDSAVYNNDDVDFVGGAFTSKAVAELRRMVAEDERKRGIDMLLTASWPAELEQHIPEDAVGGAPPVIEGAASWKSFAAPPIAELAIALEPRYHLFGTANIFYQRPPFQALRRHHACRCIGLGKVGSTGKQRKWLHALSLAPMAAMKREDLRQLPPGTTPCPFPSELLKQGFEGDAAEPAAKKAKVTAAAQGSSGDAEKKELLEGLRRGDVSGYAKLAAALASCKLASGAAKDVEAPKPVVEIATKPVVYRGPRNAMDWADEHKKKEDENFQLHKSLGLRELEDDRPLTEEEKAAKEEAEAALKKPPEEGFVRYTFEMDGPMGIRFSRDMPPWILDIHDGSLAARKAPRVPVGGIVHAVNGYKITDQNKEAVMKQLARRPVHLEVEWPQDQGVPNVKFA
eukprot:TRINITY_DN22891_c0_g1_i2.p1 TRINITY_DN22891_c0_g1~~TRINITY_DN22891_c0_g1_i2.p1  ORF type:complete len:504 (+),score=178.26 TRINITY_DN22891_c0_g1_i2:284-1795(+)